MSGKYLLDTNIVISLLQGDQAVRDQIAAATNVYLCAVVLGELYYGANHSKQIEKNLNQIRSLASQFKIIACDQETAEWYGQVKSQLRAKGRPVPENDVWIAAIACQYSLTLATRDTHFEAIDTLNQMKW